MKRLSYIFLLAACTTLMGCMNDNWSTPENTNVFGNNDLKETNVVTLNALRTTYQDVINASANPYKIVLPSLMVRVPSLLILHKAVCFRICLWDKKS